MIRNVLKILENYNFFSKLFNFIRYKRYIDKKNSEAKKNIINRKSKYQNIISELEAHGYYVEQNFLSKDLCVNLIAVMENFIKNNPDKIWKDKNGSDHRIFGIENVSKEMNMLSKHQFPVSIGVDYLKTPIDLLMMMGNRVVYKDNNLGSGGGWHKDSYGKQYKSILYLSDVTYENGPFELVLNSNKILFNFNLFFKTNKKFPDTRFENDEVMKLIDFNRKKIVRVTGKAGTLILVDTSLLHRGAPIKNGNRYALTNYFYPSYALHMHQNSFVPRISHPLY
jgi:hypothetical protein